MLPKSTSKTKTKAGGGQVQRGKVTNSLQVMILLHMSTQEVLLVHPGQIRLLLPAQKIRLMALLRKKPRLPMKQSMVGMLAMKKVHSINKVRSSKRRSMNVCRQMQQRQRQRRVDSLLQCQRPRKHQLTKLQLAQFKACLKRPCLQCLPMPRQFQRQLQFLQATICLGSLSTAQLIFKSLCLKSWHHRQRPKCQLCQGH